MTRFSEAIVPWQRATSDVFTCFTHVTVPYRHAFEVRHPSYFCDEFFALLRAHGFAFVVANTAGKFEEIRADFVYVRLHGSEQLHVSGYTDRELDEWTRRFSRRAAVG